ncbi:hypothetical protein BTVI_66006 [Pitangus sulphuratus]|nr:hypothetical protein BTVI_66006 [Pitangus sulphuratus]
MTDGSNVGGSCLPGGTEIIHAVAGEKQNQLFTEEIIDDLTNLVENTDDRLRTQTRHVKMVDKKSTSCAAFPALEAVPSGLCRGGVTCPAQVIVASFEVPGHETISCGGVSLDGTRLHFSSPQLSNFLHKRLSLRDIFKDISDKNITGSAADGERHNEQSSGENSSDFRPVQTGKTKGVLDVCKQFRRGMLVVIVLLLIAIVVVALWPIH